MKSIRRSLALAVLVLQLAVSTTSAFVPTPTTTVATSPASRQRHANKILNPQQNHFLAKRHSRFSAVGPLEASPLIAFASSPAGALLVLAGIVLVHESGHYLAARSFGIAVEEFSIGFGPKILGFSALGNEFNLRALPLGGYVRFPENYNMTAAQEQAQQAYLAEKEDKKKRNTSTGKELLNSLSFGFLDRQQRKSQEAERLRQAQELEKLPFWRKLGKSKSSKESVAPTESTEYEYEIDYYDNPDLLQNRPWPQRAVVLSAGVVFNLLLSFTIYFGIISNGPGLPRPVFESGIVVNAAPRADTPANGVLRKGDVIVSVNGSPISLSASPTSFEAQKAISEFIATIRATPDGESLQLSVLHPNDSKPVALSIKPGHQQTGPGVVGPQSIGILLVPNFVKSEIMQSDSPIEAARLAFGYATEVTTQTANGLLSFAGEALSGKGGPAGQQVSGPIGLIKTGSQIVATKDWNSVLLFAAAISINLGVVNAFPLPALDGGQLVFVLAEAVTGRKIDQQVQEGIISFTVLLLLLSSVGAAFGDVQSIFIGK